MKILAFGLYSLGGFALATVPRIFFGQAFLPPFLLGQVSIPIEAVISLMSASIAGVGAFYVAQMKSDSGDRELEKSISAIAASLEKELNASKTQISDRIDRGQEGIHQAIREVERQALTEIARIKTDLALLTQESQRGDLDHSRTLEQHSESLTILKGRVTQVEILLRQMERDNDIRRGIGGGPITGATL